MTAAAPGYCAIDFGTSNSAIAIAAPGDAAAAMRLVELEPGQRTMPTAVFYAADGGLHGQPQCEFGRAAVSAYVDGIDGRLMRSMKSILGSSLIEQTTDIGGGRAVRYLDVVATYLAHLRRRAEAEAGAGDRPGGARPAGVLRRRRSRARRPGRAGAAHAPPCAPAFARSSSSTSRSPPPSTTSRGCAARRRCSSPTSAAAPPTSRSSGSGRAGRGRPSARPTSSPTTASTSPAPTSTAGSSWRACCRSSATAPSASPRADQPAREVPSAVYFDLATWHLINTVYNPLRVAELRGMRSFYADPAQHRRLMSVVDQRLGHELLARAETAKISGGRGRRDGDLARPGRGRAERGLRRGGRPRRARRRSRPDRRRRARDRAPRPGSAPGEIDALYFTGGSTGLRLLTERLQQAFPAARPVRGDRFASVASGLALHAARRFGKS